MVNNQSDIKKAWKKYYDASPEDFMKKMNLRSAEEYEQYGTQWTIEAFREMARRVPAYRDFLKKQKVNPAKIKTREDILHIPQMDKESYLRQYPLAAMCWDGKLRSPIISASSGSSGIPSFWPRSEILEIETTQVFELFLKYVFGIDRKSTLLISGFAMGIYVGGTFTLNCCMRIAQKGYPLTIITPGLNKEEILLAVEKLHPYFDQIILGAYPPFVKDILEEGVRRGIDWKSKNIKLFFASEALSEGLRTYLYDIIGTKRKDYYASSMNLYGTADAGIAGHETPFSVFMSKILEENPEARRKMFGIGHAPSINQFYPSFKYFEIQNGEVLFSSAHTEMPLLRYNIHDRGRIVHFNEMLEAAKGLGYSNAEVFKAIGGSSLWRMPFIALYGRTDLAVILSGANIYPETVRHALDRKELRKTITGKFTMLIERDKKENGYLSVHIECRKGIRPMAALKQQAMKIIVEMLLKENVEYRILYEKTQSRMIPKVRFWPYGDSRYFAQNIKQRWIKK